ncbi:flagellar export protein FliJ [Lacrimispora algidixylanolytica]|uniref:Flagellar FliJ protein n=1 Tax=Lacrimispora algidixylanolytica TaxID=94868 RepID=A0A419T6H5_9FIRM|nr:flagellar export protein FliJ [Lacrimispora algidixylanolytica]RKD33032.1 flagellar export protein FliJ [Lacrimispora algidixylanolytica]
MKKFSFPLDTVLNYKDQILDNLKSEHALILTQVSKQEQKIFSLSEQRGTACTRFREETHCGMSVSAMREYESYITYMQQRILFEEGTLKKLKKKEEHKRDEVVEAKKEKSSIEKLKEKKLTQYNKEVLRSEELFIEEFVSNTMSVRNSR